MKTQKNYRRARFLPGSLIVLASLLVLAACDMPTAHESTDEEVLAKAMLPPPEVDETGFNFVLPRQPAPPNLPLKGVVPIDTEFEIGPLRQIRLDNPTAMLHGRAPRTGRAEATFISSDEEARAVMGEAEIPLYYETRVGISALYIEVDGWAGYLRYPLVVKGPRIGRIVVPVAFGNGRHPRSVKVTIRAAELGGQVSNSVVVKVNSS